ncbi:MAG: hypothetical protein LIO85_06320 [Rikenellaceae bacterium]|nr:hypothetical protein [Rikenellaceae bacterium]
MKRIALITALLLAAALAGPTPAAAQVSISININRQPSWGPSGYDFVRFYYFPELNIYYDVESGLFYVHTGRIWRSYRNLPRRYRHHDLYVTYKVVINQDRPWTNNSAHVRQYASYKSNRSQVPIRDSCDERYNNSRSQPAVSGRGSSGRNDRSVRSSESRSSSSGRNSGNSSRGNSTGNNNSSRNSSRGR